MGLLELQERYLGLREELDAAEEKAKAMKGQYESLQETLAEAMAAAGQTSTTLHGKRLTLRITPRISRAQTATAEALIDALNRDAGFAFLVKPGVNAQSLQGAMKEYMDQNDNELPPALAPYLNVWEQVNVAITKG